MAQKAVFLDRDDTLIEDPGYISDPAQVKLLPGAAKALIDLKKMGYKTIVVSNQSGVARGIVTEQTLKKIHSRLKQLLNRQNAYLDAIYYCPYHPEGSVGKYRKESSMRKPNPGMLLKAAEEMDIDLENSWMVGDSYRDVTAGKKAGCKTVLIDSSAKRIVKELEDAEPDHKAVNILETVNVIKMFDRQSHITVQAVRAQKDAGLRDEPVEIKQTDEIIEEQPPVEETESTDNTQQDTQQPELETQSEQTETIEPHAELEPQQSVEEVEQNDDIDEQTTINQITEQIEEVKDYAQAATNQQTPPVDLSSEHIKTHRLLEDINITLKKMQRHAMFNEFSIMRVFTWTLQILACGLVILSLIFLLDIEKKLSSVYITLAYAAIVQLMALVFSTMEGRK